MFRQFRLDFRVRVVDDGEEHVQEDEEDEEDIEDEVGWTEDAVCLLQRLEVEVSEDDTEQGEAVGDIQITYQFMRLFSDLMQQILFSHSSRQLLGDIRLIFNPNVLIYNSMVLSTTKHFITC